MKSPDNHSTSDRARDDQSPRERDRTNRKPSSRLQPILISMSFVFSTLVIGYAFSIPFRNVTDRVSAVESQEVSLDPTTRSLMKRSESHRRREQAFQDHADFLDDLARTRANRSIGLPGGKEVRTQWELHSIELKADRAKLRKQIRKNKLPEDGAIAQHLQYIEKILEDVPR